MQRPGTGRRVLAGLVPVLVTVLVALLAAAAALLPVAPAAAARTDGPVSGPLTGHAFDARCAPTQAEMDAWLRGSPFWAVGIYLGGSTMSCRPTATHPGQPHLDAGWVQRQTRNGWRLLPIWVGPQASCSSYADRIDATPDASYAAAEAQGRAEAAAAVAAARALGLRAGGTLWYDLEGGFKVDDDDCRRSALRFLSGWTLALHERGHRSGVYSSAADGIHALDNADNLSPGSYAMPDRVWYAWYNGRADTAIDPRWVRGGSWAGDRVHQYAGTASATYGGVTLSIDRNYLELEGGSVAPPARRSCGVRVDFADYPTLRTGRSGAAVKAAQCLLRHPGRYRGRIDGRYDRDVAAAVRRHQRARSLPVTGTMTARTWIALLSAGAGPILKEGSVGHDVRRLQRALNVATAADRRVTGVYDARTGDWVRRYQRSRGLEVTGVAEGRTWSALRQGRR